MCRVLLTLGIACGGWTEARPLGIQAPSDFASLFEEYRHGKADEAVAAFARWPWPRVETDANIPTKNNGDRAALALFHIEAGLVRGAFGTPFLRDNRILNGTIEDLEPHYRHAVKLVGELANEDGFQHIAPRLLLSAEGIRFRHSSAFMSDDWAQWRWFGSNAPVQLSLGIRGAWWAQPLVDEGPYGLGACLAAPCPSPLSTLAGPAAARPIRRAERAFRKAIELDDDLLEAHLRLGRLLHLTRLQNDAKNVLEALRKRMVAQPDRYIGYLTSLFLGEVYEHSEAPEEALDAYLAAVAARPDAVSARIALAQLLLRKGESRLGWRTLREIPSPNNTEAEPDPWMEFGAGQFREVADWIGGLRSTLGISQPFGDRRRTGASVAAAGSPGSAGAPARAGTPGETSSLAAEVRRSGQVFRSRVDAVRLDVRVRHRDQAVTGLTAQHFEVLDKGVRQQVQLLPSHGRLALALVLDLSHSSQPDVLKDLIGAANRVIDGLLPDDEVTFITFGDRISIEVHPTRDHGAVRRALTSARTHWAGRSTTRDALFVASAFALDAAGYPVVVLLGDGGDNACWLPERRALELTRATGVIVDVVRSEPQYPYDMDLAYGRHPRPYITEESGGQIFNSTQPDLRAAIFERLADLRQHYILSFVPSGVSPRGWHKLTTRLKDSRGTVHVRQGYFGGFP